MTNFLCFYLFVLKKQKEMKKITTLFAYILPFFIAAQTPNSTELHAQFDQIGKSQRPATVPVFDTRYEGVKGSRFSIETYNLGEIWLTDGRHFTTELKYRFDELENSVQVQYIDGKELLLFNNYVLKCQIFKNDTIITYRKAAIEGEKELHKLYQVLYEGENYSLLKLPTRKVVRVDEKSALTIGRLYDQITPIFHYYFKTSSSIFKEIKLKKKDLLKFLPTKKAALESLFKTPQYEGDLDEPKLVEIFQKIDKD